MNSELSKAVKLVAVSALSCVLASVCLAGKSQKWEDLPETVRATILAHGGTVGQSVDLENGKNDGKAIYEAGVKDKEGNVSDLVVAADGKLVEVKTDDAADKAAEQAAHANKALARLKFSHPKDITNPYLPLGTLVQDILEGKEGGKAVRIERTAKPDLNKTFKIGSQEVEALAFEDREFEDGQLAEVALDYIAQADDGAVYYLGENVNSYKDGKVVDHEGSWLLGKDTQNPGVLMPAHPKAGAKFKSEDVSKDVSESDEVISVSETVKAPAGTWRKCVKIKETLSDGSIEYKYYASGVGCVREPDDVLLKVHKTK